MRPILLHYKFQLNPKKDSKIYCYGTTEEMLCGVTELLHRYSKNIEDCLLVRCYATRQKNRIIRLYDRVSRYNFVTMLAELRHNADHCTNHW